MKQFMRKPHEGRRLLFGKKNKRDDKGSAIVIVIIAMALIGILASTILWAAYLNYRIKVNDLKVKNSFYSAETVVEQILAGVKKNIVSESINEAYQEVLSNWDALGSDENRQSYFITAYVEAVEDKLGVTDSGGVHYYNKNIIKEYVDQNLWEGASDNDPLRDGYIVNKPWNDAVPLFKQANDVNGWGSMSVRNICIEFYDSDGLLSIINTDIAIDVPSLRFTQAGTIDRLYPYVLVGDDGIVADSPNITINGSIYGGVDEHDKGGIQLTRDSHVTVEDAAYIISGGDIVLGNDKFFVNSSKQNAELIVRDVSSGGIGFRTNVYAQGFAVNGSHLDISGRMFIANDLILAGRESNVSLSGQYFGYGGVQETTHSEEVEAEDGGTTDLPLNPAAYSSAIVINGKNSTVDLTGLNTLQLAGRAYVSLTQDEDAEENGLPHILMGESISVKSNQIAYLVPAECVGTVDGKTVIGQNPMSFETWKKMINDLPQYEEQGEFRLVDSAKAAAKLGGESLSTYNVAGIKGSDLSGIDTSDITKTIDGLNSKAKSGGIRFIYKQGEQIYMYLVMDKDSAEQYFAQYYNVNSNKDSLDKYFNQYASGGIRLKDNVQGYTVMGNSMVSLTDAANNDRIQTSPDGDNLVRLLSSVTPSTGDGDSQPADPDIYTEVSDNVTNVEGAKTVDELRELMKNSADTYANLNSNLLETDAGDADTVFENLIRLHKKESDPEGVVGLQEYLDADADGIVYFTSGSGLKAVLVDSKRQGGNRYIVSDTNLRLVIATGDVEVRQNFQGLIIADGEITVAANVTCKKDGEGVYDVLQAKSEVEGDVNVPANVLANGSGMIQNGYEDADVDENGNLNINYNEIVRYENWIKK
ncbi:MAG: hypothetical protein J1F42_11350 [Lachnospiraceae bacterium]|nr:hypothetical protein [Lachnospiraceae bacterium]